MANPTAGREKINSMRARKSLDISVLGQVLGRLVLNVVVEGEDRLPG